MVNHNYLPMSKIKPTKFLDTTKMVAWLESNDIFGIIFGENTHLEIVKRSSKIIKFLSNKHALPENFVSLVWKSQEGKHEEMVRTIYEIIKDVVQQLSVDIIDDLFIKIKSVTEASYDEKYLEFLRDFTFKAIENHYQEKMDEMTTDEKSPIDYGR